MDGIRKAAVIGAGVMGSGIAAHLANAGAQVVLLDMEASTAAAAVAKQLKAGGFMDPAFAEQVASGSVAEDLGLLADADWIIEAVAERLDVKRPLYHQIDAIRKEGSIVSSNTSTIELSALTEGMSEAFAANFLITHFFNPPRTMRLMELVAGPRTRPGVAEAIRDFADRRLGKCVVLGRDTPGFIANRIGNFWMAAAVNEAVELGIDIETADAALSKPFGIPKTGVFALGDLVGIDVVALVWRSLHAALPASDPLRQYPEVPEIVARLVVEERLGRKAGAGFFRTAADRKSREAVDLATGEYRPWRKPGNVLADPRALMADDGPAGRYAAAVFEKTLAYAAEVAPEIADGPDAVDTALRTGYGWRFGPFELIDRLGAGWLAQRLTERGIAAPPYLTSAAVAGGFHSIDGGKRFCLLPDRTRRAVKPQPGTLSLAALALGRASAAQWDGGKLWDLGDGVACFEIRSKLNTISPAVLHAIEAALDQTEREFKALVIGSDGAIFSAGADLRSFINDPSAALQLAELGQNAFAAVKYAPFPVVGAAAGLAIGGGCELLLHCTSVQAHAELAMGLVEPRVGLVPGWGGCKEMLLRLAENPLRPHGPVAPAIAAFELIATARVTTSAFEARALGFLRPEDGISMNRDRLLADAKARALALSEGYVPPEHPQVTLAGAGGEAALRNAIMAEATAGRMTAHDRTVAEALARVLTGGNGADPRQGAGESAILALERSAVTSLLAAEPTLERIGHMLATGAPLRN